MMRLLKRIAAVLITITAATITMSVPTHAEGPVEFVTQNGFAVGLPFGQTQCVTLAPTRPAAPDQRFTFQFASAPNAVSASYNYGTLTTKSWQPEFWLQPPVAPGFEAQACVTNTNRNPWDPQGRNWVQVAILYYATPGY